MGGVTRAASLLRRHGLDALIAAFGVFGMIEVTVKHGTANGSHSPFWFALPAIAVLVSPLLARRRAPFAAVVAFWVFAAVVSFVDGRLLTSPTSVFVLGMTASFLLGHARERVRAWQGLAVVLAAAAIVVVNGPSDSTSTIILNPLLFGICWLGGYTVRERAEQAEAAEERALAAERERESAARLAVAEERARIARELHDVVAHAVSVMVLQVGTVRHRLPDALADDRAALRAAEQAGRSALTEMRRLLGAMRDQGRDLDLAPQPGLDRLDALVAEVGRAGLPVHLHVEGDPVALPRGVDLSAYRIVQEGLTNALKHARATRVDVTVHYRGKGLDLIVRDDGVGTASANGAGFGLVGIRERVKLYRGAMTAQATPGGGFELRASLPLDEVVK